MRRLLRVLFVTLALGGAATAAFAGGFSTSFEFTDVSGEFILGEAPNTVTFTGGQAKTVFIPGLYHSGMNSWMVDFGNLGTITFETPVMEVDLWFRDQTSGVNGVLRVFDELGAEIAMFNGSTTWTNVKVTVGGEDPRIGTISLKNNGISGYTVIDDFTCGSDVDTGLIPEPIPPAPVLARLETVATGLTAPNAGTFAPGLNPRAFFVTDQDGILWQMDTQTGTKRVFLDVSARLVTLGIIGPGSFDERGLLGLAFHPDYATNGFFYIYTSEPAGIAADFSTLPELEEPDHQSVISEWHVPDPTDLMSLPDTGSVRVLLRIDQPQFNHDGGGLVFGPDGMLYISLGDGGEADDQGIGHSVGGNGQDPSNVLGTLLRIDPLGNNAPNGQYGIPPDNPFITPVTPAVGGEAGCVDGFCDEIFAYGLRNPFRFSFDRLTGALLLADVGQNDIEEIDFIRSGRNYGWPLKEGSFCFDDNGAEAGFAFECLPGQDPPGVTDPIAEFDHDEGIAIIGGFVYRGAAIPQAQGSYVFGDYARTFQSDGRLFALTQNLKIFEILFEVQGGLGLFLLGLGEDANGEIYVLGNTTGVPFGDTGVVQRVAAGP